jgi:hypothetical protein
MIGRERNSPPGTWSNPVEQIITGFDGDRWVTASEARIADIEHLGPAPDSLRVSFTIRDRVPGAGRP